MSQPIRVLIVDDSVVFRSQIKGALEGNPSIEIVGTAANGKIAISKLTQAPTDLITLDCEMPELNGIDTIKEIRRLGMKTRIIMFSSQTAQGAALALEALRVGADDVLAKPSANPGMGIVAMDLIKAELLPRVLQFVQNPPSRPSSVLPSVSEPLVMAAKGEVFQKTNLSFFSPSALVIGSSTGGPKALETVLAGLGTTIRIPIFVVQHMPPVFTEHLARRLTEISGIQTGEAQDMEELSPNRIYVAPGDFHMTVANIQGTVRIRLDQGPQVNSVRPAVDNLFRSAVEVYGARCLGVVLTGMGEDGCLGAKLLKRAGAGVVIQDKESCVVFGMPGSVHTAGAFDQMGDLTQIREVIGRMVRAV